MRLPLELPALSLGRFGPERLPTSPRARLPRLSQARSVAVVGGGLAGLAAATVLAERGASVTVLERESFLGGRVGSWMERLEDGESFEMERGFHAFFRQYYNLRALLRRVDPRLERLRKLEDYPILGAAGEVESFSRLPALPPFNVLGLIRRTSTLKLTDLVHMDVRAALAMLAFDQERTYARHDGRTAREYLDSLRFPLHARRMLFDVFSHSFFNPEEALSAAELLMMFHFYFMGNPEGLVFDVLDDPFATAVWLPLRRYLEGLGVRFRLGEEVTAVALREGGGVRVMSGQGAHVDVDAAVLSTSVEPLKRMVAGSPDLRDVAWRQRIDSLALTSPFAVWRLWLDRPSARGRHPFVGTTGMGTLDNISLYHLCEGESRRWASRTGGAVVELHGYGLPLDVDEASVRRELLDGLHRLYPECAGRAWWRSASCCAATARPSRRARSGCAPPWRRPFPRWCSRGTSSACPFPPR
ncbi:FAD-dependent oxidoreductase [Pyxidicoccus sp. 3LG]